MPSGISTMRFTNQLSLRPASGLTRREGNKVLDIKVRRKLDRFEQKQHVKLHHKRKNTTGSKPLLIVQGSIKIHNKFGCTSLDPFKKGNILNKVRPPQLRTKTQHKCKVKILPNSKRSVNSGDTSNEMEAYSMLSYRGEDNDFSMRDHS